MTKPMYFWVLRAEELQRKGMTLREIAREMKKDYGEIVYHLFHNRYRE